MHWLLVRRRHAGPSVGTPAAIRRVGSGRRVWSETDTGRAHCSALGVRALEHLENCIASASIYEFKLVRAYGGCLGARSR